MVRWAGSAERPRRGSSVGALTRDARICALVNSANDRGHRSASRDGRAKQDAAAATRARNRSGSRRSGKSTAQLTKRNTVRFSFAEMLSLA
jgi:hypothetical protein